MAPVCLAPLGSAFRLLPLRPPLASTVNTAIQTLQQLPVIERVQAAGDLWDSIVEDGAGHLGLTEEQRAELDRRLDDLVANPGDNLTWENVKSGILARL